MDRKLAAAGIAGVTSLGMTAQSFADLPAVVGTEIATIQADALAAQDLAWPLVMAVLGGFVIFKIVKRAVNKV